MSTFSLYDVVRLRDLKSKPHWNNSLAQIIGPYSKDRQRYPVSIIPLKSVAWIRPTNIYSSACIESGIQIQTQQNQAEIDGNIHHNTQSIILSDTNVLKHILSYLVPTAIKADSFESAIISNIFLVNQHWANCGSSLVESFEIRNVDEFEHSRSDKRHVDHSGYFPPSNKGKFHHFAFVIYRFNTKYI
eukprot:535050_1